MNDRPVLFICKDSSGVDNIVPLFEEAEKREIPSVLVADGAAVEALVRQKISFRYYPNFADLWFDISNPSVVVTSMCSGGGIGLDLVQDFRSERKTPTVAVSAYWGVLPDKWIERASRTNYVIVNDDVDAGCVKKAWGVDDDHVKRLGFPSLDRFARFDVEGAKECVRNFLRIRDAEEVVVFLGTWNGSTHALAQTVAALNQLDRSVTFIARECPRMHKDAPTVVVAWEAACAAFTGGRLVPSGAVAIDLVLARADVVVSSYSTKLKDVAALKRPAIAFLDDTALADYRRETHELLDEHPLVSLGCAAKATNVEELASLIARALETDSLGLEETQHRVLRLDGRNAERGVDFIATLIKT